MSKAASIHRPGRNLSGSDGNKRRAFADLCQRKSFLFRTSEHQDSLLRLKVGSSLSITELMHIASLLETALRAKSYGRRETDDMSTDSLDGFLTPLNRYLRYAGKSGAAFSPKKRLLMMPALV